MFSGSFGNGNFQGGMHKDIDPSVNYDNPPTTRSTAEGKAAEKVVGLLDKMSFNETIFAHHLVSAGGPGFRRRILGIAIAIIKTYAIEYENGLYQDDVAVNAMRLKDTCDQFKM